MPNIEKYSGVDMANIEKISGQDVPSGGTTANAVVNTGLQMYGSTVIWANPNVPANLNIGPAYTTNTFTKIVASRSYLQFHALKSDGTLWYWSQNTTYMSTSYFTSDGTWRQYGTDTDWTDICGGQVTFGAIKGGNIMFLGAGGNRQRGDGSSGNVSNWTTVNTAGNWTQIFHGYRSAWAINSSGEAYASGYGYDYQLGQGNTSLVSTFTREQFSLTDIVEVVCGYRCAWLRNSSGDVYFTGANSNGYAGPRITTTSSRNGPLLAVNSSIDYVCAKVCGHSYHGGCHIDSDGYLRFSGEGISVLRPDNSTTDARLGSGGLKLTSLGSGWTHYDAVPLAGSTTEHLGIGIKSGAFWIGGEDSQEFKEVFGQTVNSNWYQVRTGVTTAAQRAGVLIAG
jgi:alpha-tubulin suppressor-like RCC1 family protein